jgi:hypothetical protein
LELKELAAENMRIVMEKILLFATKCWVPFSGLCQGLRTVE